MFCMSPSRPTRSEDPRPWIAAPFVLLTDVIAAADPWTGILLDPRHPQPLPVGGLLRLLDRQDLDVPSVCLVWPDTQLRLAAVANDPKASPPSSTSPRSRTSRAPSTVPKRCSAPTTGSTTSPKP